MLSSESLSNRKISVSFVSEPPQSNVYDQGHADPTLKDLQQKILRFQVLQVILCLTLSVISAVAIIEERSIFGLGFSIISAFLTLFSSAIGIQQWNDKGVFVANIFALIFLMPAFFFTLESLIFSEDVAEENVTTGVTRKAISWLILFHLIPILVSFICILILFRSLYLFLYSNS